MNRLATEVRQLMAAHRQKLESARIIGRKMGGVERLARIVFIHNAPDHASHARVRALLEIARARRDASA